MKKTIKYDNFFQNICGEIGLKFVLLLTFVCWFSVRIKDVILVSLSPKSPILTTVLKKITYIIVKPCLKNRIFKSYQYVEENLRLLKLEALKRVLLS